MKNKQQENHYDKSNYFDIRNLDEIAGLDSHIAFAEGLIAKYDWDAATRASFISELDIIKKKQADKLLNLAVIGEFNTGKSTFINAMIRQSDFLKNKQEQGTTVAATVIENSENYKIDVLYNNGTRQVYTYRTIDELKSGHIFFTAESKLAKEIHNVKLFLPTPTLEAGFRIIDTPGTDANEAWHEQVTSRTIREMADMAILIIDATKQLPESFCEFINLHLSDMLENCIFVVTRMDLIRRREREDVIGYLKQKISLEFGIEDPVVLPYASIDVLDSMGADEPSELAADAFAAEKQMLNIMTKLKLRSQAQKLILLINSLYVAISEKIQLLSGDYKKELNYLLKSRQTDLGPFVKKQIGETQACFDAEVERLLAGMKDGWGDVVAKSAWTNIMNPIHAAGTVNELKTFAQQKLSELCRKECQMIIDFATREYNKIIDSAFHFAMGRFHAEFEKVFRDLNILKVDFKEAGCVIQKQGSIEPYNFAIADHHLDKVISNQNALFFGGAAAGAAIGTAIAPGVGTLIGGFLGFVGGSMFAPNINDVKVKFQQGIEEPVKKAIDSAFDIAGNSLNDYFLQVINNDIPREIDKYGRTYKRVVDEKLAEEKRKISSVENKIVNINTDVESIGNRRFVLEALSKQLKEMV